MGLFTLMYLHAHRRRDELGMTALDGLDARIAAGQPQLAALEARQTLVSDFLKP
jgi:hypothetical protein